MILYITSHKTGELLGEREASKDIKDPNRLVIPPYHTTECLPSEALTDNEYWAYLGKSGSAVRDHTLGSWVKRERHVKVVAYLKSDCTQKKDFEDKSLVTGKYTTVSPKTRFDEWIDNIWVTNLESQYEFQVNEISNKRSHLYLEVDKLRNEAISASEFELDEVKAEKCREEARALYFKIKEENPWPEKP